jgi:hypothetical protein
MLWYSIEKKTFPFHVPFRTPVSALDEGARARLAELCAEEYHDQHDGQSHRWPIIVELHEQNGGPVVSRHSVDRQSAPVFMASTLSAA